MDAGKAWTLLTHRQGIGVVADGRYCELKDDRRVVCTAQGTDEDVVLNHSQFLLEFSGKMFQIAET